MSSKIPVSVPRRRDTTKFLTPTKNNVEKLRKSQSSLSSSDTKKTQIDKYKHIKPKISTHWSPEEKSRSGLKTFFNRKPSCAGNSSISSTSPDYLQQQSKRLSLPAKLSIDQTMSDAIAQLRCSTTITSVSESCSSNNSSFVSLPDFSSNYDLHRD